MEKGAIHKKKANVFINQLNLNLRKTTSKRLHLKNSAENWAFRKVNQEYFDIALERMEKIIFTNRVRDE